ncbi:MAG: cbb3-type cytochrome c oxidase subunit 3 [Proteobacteria bacterium]|nr:cbb3-type cytochrome c oxidase subunit 3 [Pseudomonadota bacterium]
MAFDQLVALTRVVGLVLFLGFFLGVLAWVFRPGSRRLYEAGARVPFADDGAREPRHG